MQTGEKLLEAVRKYNAWDARCPSRRLLDLIADKWTTLVLVVLAPTPKFYSQIRRDVSGISHKMLSQTLRTLEEQHLVLRTVYPTVPPRVEYALTPLAETLVPTLLALIGWAESHASEFQLLACPSPAPTSEAREYVTSGDRQA
jgi:DNA-binding HxlR family transcriptional regulator